jgi:hypothetical protein
MSTEAQRKAILESQASREAQAGLKAERLAEAARQERIKRRMSVFLLPIDEGADDAPKRRKKFA